MHRTQTQSNILEVIKNIEGGGEGEKEKERERERESVCVCEREREREREFLKVSDIPSSFT